jgi:hypothetical protein
MSRTVQQPRSPILGTALGARDYSPSRDRTRALRTKVVRHRARKVSKQFVLTMFL